MSTRKQHPKLFSESALIAADARLMESARIAIRDSLSVKANEKVLIVTNPDAEVSAISRALYDAAAELGAKAVLLFQPVKTQMDFAEEAVISAFGAKPDVFVSMSAEKLGKDRSGIASPYELGDRKWDHVFHLQLYGEKTCRAFWSPGVTLDSFVRTVPLDYALLKSRCAAVKRILDAAVSVRVTAPGGTDIVIGLEGRSAKSDDGDFSRPGTGGNLPAGETFVSPANGTANGTIAFDGSMSLHDGDVLIETPIVCAVSGGYITGISGGAEASALLETISLAERNAKEYEASGRLPSGSGAVYAKNARNIGELGIGLNPEAAISGNMLEDEKAFRTCHFAVGHNYDEDAPALIHLDGLVRRPTITARLPNGSEIVIEREGELSKEIESPDR